MFFKVVYSVVVPLFRIFFRLVFFARAYGRENVLKSGGFIVSANHKSNFDPILLGSFLPRKMKYLAKRELFNNKFLGWLLQGLGVVPITRGSSDIGTLKAVISLMKNNEIIAVFPEGTRRIKDVNDVKSGAVMFAIKGQVPILPVAIIGEYKLFGGIKIVYGKPIHYSEYYGKRLSQEELHNLSVDLMQKIYNLAEGK